MSRLFWVHDGGHLPRAFAACETLWVLAFGHYGLFLSSLTVL
jgi:hypothetical protein